LLRPAKALWTPLTGPQTRAYQSQADILGYGGAAGGGKSDLILGLAVTQHQRSIIFRREAKQGRSLIDRSRELLTGQGRFNENLGVWRDVPGGRQIEFAGVKDPADVFNWRGQPHDFIGIDEADGFLETMVRFLLGWNRTTVPGQRCRVVLAFNPPATAAGRWLLTFFGPWLDTRHARPAAPGELRWYAMVEGEEVERPSGEAFTHVNAGGKAETIRPLSRTFIPAKVQDNPYLVKTNYVAQLQALPEPLRSQLLEGDMAAGLEDDPWQVIPAAWVQAAMARWTPEPPPKELLTAIGVDVARGGRNSTVLAKRHGPWFDQLVKVPGAETPDGPTAAALVLAHHSGSATVNVDVIGVGGSVYDVLKDGRGLDVVPVNNAEASDLRDKSGKFRLVNVRAASYWSLREALDPTSGQALALPPDRELLADLTAPRWKVTASGILIEAKEDIIRRIGRSPDCGDAVVLAHWVGGAVWHFEPAEPRETSLIARLPLGVLYHQDPDEDDRW
jgi:hypothetical protein